MKRAFAIPTLALVAFVVSCGGGKTGKALQPNDPTAKNALDPASVIKECKPAPGEPLVVDLKSNERSDFELAMKEGVAVVSYNCKELHLLKSCTLHGIEYKFTTVTLKEDVVQLSTKDEVMANIPISGAKLSAELQSGSTLELALITVGKKHYKQPVYHDELKGDCDGATHVVRGAYIGAFAMGTGTVGQASAVAEMFGAGAGGSSVSKKKATTKDGNLDACHKATKADKAPPDACQAITRLDLSPIRPGSNPEKDKEKPPGGEEHPPVAEPGFDPSADGPAPPPPSSMSDVASSSKSSSSKPGTKTASKKPVKPAPGKKPSSASAAPPPPPSGPMSASASASASRKLENDSADVEETPSCPEGFKWNGVICKKQ